MRELTKYERDKWFDPDLGPIFGFKLSDDDFLLYGDELGEAFTIALRATQMRDYGLSDEFVKMAQIQALDLYYDQVIAIFGERWEQPEDHGLPSFEISQGKWDELSIGQDVNRPHWPNYGEVYTFPELMEFWDWCMEWRENNA